MRRIFFILAAGFLGLALTGGVAEAKDGGHRGGHRDGHGGMHRGYHHDHGQRFAGGYYYRGRSHSHWGHRTWDARYGRYNYWDAGLNTYFYYVPSVDCYYPVGYAP